MQRAFGSPVNAILEALCIWGVGVGFSGDTIQVVVFITSGYVLEDLIDLSCERNKWFIANKRHREKNEIRQDRAEQDIVDLAVGVLLADPVEIAEFKMELDTYDALTVEAIMENRAILEKLYRHREVMLNNAYQLEDGTRVFKSEGERRGKNGRPEWQVNELFRLASVLLGQNYHQITPINYRNSNEGII